jgi:tetratricopeptide (TPR) repeat protein
MPITTLNELNPQQKQIFHTARGALTAKNYDYTLTLMQPLLKQVPLFLEGRRVLRTAAIQKFKGVGTLAKTMINAQALTILARLSTGKRTPEEALAIAEEALAIDPYHIKANNVIADSGRGINGLELAAFSYETIKEGNPKNKANLFALGDVYMELREPEKAEAAYDAILAFDPIDGDAKTRSKNASALKTSMRRGWEDAEKSGDFRGALAKPEESLALERDAKSVKSEEAVLQQIQDLYEKSEADPANLNYPKRIAALYEQIDRFDDAINWYRFAFDHGGQTDGSLEKRIDDLGIRKIERPMADLRSRIEAGDETAQAEHTELNQQLIALKVETSRRRVERYPNEFQYHFEYGEALLLAGQAKEALPELQLGAKQPNVRHRALLYIGQAYRSRNMKDLAIKTLVNAKTELPTMTDVKKDITYDLGHFYRANGQYKEAVEQWKEIYEVDMAYKDVAKLVEESYENENGETDG